MATHTDIRGALVTLVTGLTVGGYVLRVSDASDALDMVSTEQGGHVVAVLVQDAPGDQWGGTRSFVAVLSAAAGRGCNEPVARATMSTLAAALRTAMLAQGALGSIGTQVIAAQSETIQRDGDVVVLRQTYQLQAPA